MNPFEQMKAEILAKYPSIKTLGFVDRLRCRFSGQVSQYTIFDQTEFATYSQSAVLIKYKGKEYTLRLGRLS